MSLLRHRPALPVRGSRVPFAADAARRPASRWSWRSVLFARRAPLRAEAAATLPMCWRSEGFAEDLLELAVFRR